MILGPVTKIQHLIEAVEGLVESGVLNDGQGNALISKLEAALSSLENGNTNAACNQLQAFVNQVGAFVTSGVLPPQEGEELDDAAAEIMNLLGC